MKNGEKIYIGVDVGNLDTKTSHASFLSGYSVFEHLPFGADPDRYIEYDGRFYVLSENDQFAYRKDKTTDEKMFILTLFGIAMETEFLVNRKIAKNGGVGSLKESVAEIGELYLGVGLPPSHMALLAGAVRKYYETHFGDTVEFTYKGCLFSLSLKGLGIYAQNLAVITANKNVAGSTSIIATEDEFYTLDWGGYTFDKVSIVNGRLNHKECDSLDKGIITLCDQISGMARNDFGVSLSSDKIIRVLKNRSVSFSRDIVDFIRKSASDWTLAVLSEVEQGGLEFSLNPVVFMGGTSLLLRDYIGKCTRFCRYEILDDPNANADAYRKLVRHEFGEGR